MPRNMTWKGLLQSVLPGKDAVRSSLRTLAYVLLGGGLLYPLMARLPVLGWDWYFFFTAHHPVDNIYSPNSPFFPYTKYVLAPLTQTMDWRQSLALLAGLTFMAIAIGTWINGGRYGSIALALLNPLPLFALWVGHPDGLALLGLLTGIVPLALIKPQVTIWAFLQSKKHFFWMALTLGLVLLIWPNWLRVPTGMHWDHEASFGWQALGWPMLLVGAALLFGAGRNPWRLMAAGCFLMPDLMPYHVIVLLPALGYVKGWRKIAVWLAAWLIALGLGMGGAARYLSLLFPISIYLSTHTWAGYRAVVMGHRTLAREIIGRARARLLPES